MPDDLITIRLRLTGGPATAAEAKAVAGRIEGIGDSTSTTMAKGEKSTSRFRSTLSSLGRTVAYSAIPVIGALGYEVTRSVNAYREAAKIGDQTNAVIKSTGRAANVSADEVARLSETLSLKTGVDDEEIQSGANMLLTFKNIRNEAGKGNDIFNQSLETLNDVSSAMGRDMKTSAIQLGKALNDPVAGISALTRIGVTFDEQTKSTIEKLVRQGKTLKAQKIILKELTSEFGGSAKAQHDSVDKLGVAWENLEEKLGEAVYPILKDVTDWLTKALRQAQKGKGPLIDLKDSFVKLGTAIDWVGSNVLDPFIDSMKWILDHADDIHDFIEGGAVQELDRSTDPVLQDRRRGIGNADAAPSAPGGGGPRQKVPELASPPRQRRQSGGSKRPLVIHNYMQVDGKTLARSVTKHALEARARA